MFFKVDENWNHILVRDVLEWARWFETANRQVERTEIGEVFVSTVFLGVCHCSPQLDGETTYDNLFETMVFGPPDLIAYLSKAHVGDCTSIFSKFFGGGRDIQLRYRTVTEARAGHAEMVRYVQQSLAERN